VTPAELSRAVLLTVRRAVDAAELKVDVPEKVVVQRPPRYGRGDYATSVALQLAGPAGRTPREVAEILSRRLLREPGIAEVEIAGAGFLNITLSSQAYGDVVRRVLAQGAEYGRGEGLADERVTVTADRGAVRGRLVAEVVNVLLATAGARPGEPAESLTVAEPVLEPEAVPRPAPAPAPGGRPGGDPAAPLRHALDALGPDAARWALLRPPVEDAPRLGAAAVAALLAQREANPLFRIRYAHARARSLRRNAHDLGVEVSDTLEPPEVSGVAHAGTPALRSADTAVPDPRRDGSPVPRTEPPHHGPARSADTAVPNRGQDGSPYPRRGPHHGPVQAADRTPYHPAETELLGLIADFPRVVESAARRRGPDRVARHLERLADAFFRFHDECPPLPKGDEKPSAVHGARVRLADAAGIVLAAGLCLLGISAPDHI